MSDYETVLIERHDNVAVVTLNRPDKLNSFNSGLRRDLLLAVREVNEDDSVRVVILTAQGQDSERDRGASLGVDAYFTKPFSPTRILQVAREFLDPAMSPPED